MKSRHRAFIGAQIIALLFSASLGLAAELKYEATHALQNDRLFLEVMDPNAENRYYTGIRFSPVATVLRAVLDDEEFLFSTADHNPQSESAGLAMEFDLSDWKGGPPGFAEAAMGEGFLKVGVGVLKKSTDTYLFFRPYEVLERPRTEATWKGDKAVFRQSCDGVRGYAYVLEAEVSLHDAEIRVLYRLKNTGTRPFSTEHYTHNFFRFADVDGGLGYEVEFPFDFTARIPKTPIVQEGRTVRVVEPVTPKIKGAEAFISLTPDEAREESLLIRHLATGKRIRAQVSRPVERVTFHVNPRFVSPEQFVRISLAPGESTEWVRTYHLEKGIPGAVEN